MTEPYPWPEPSEGWPWPEPNQAGPPAPRVIRGQLERPGAARRAADEPTHTRSGGRKRRGRRARRRPTTTGSATLTVGFAAALVAGAFAGRPALVLGVLVVQVALVFGWLRLVELPGQAGGLVIGIGAGLAVDALLLLDPSARSMGPAAGVIAAAFLAATLYQLARRGERADAAGSLAACLFGAVLAMLAATWLPASSGSDNADVVAAMLAALAAAGLVEALTSALRLPRTVRTVAAVAVAAAAGAGVVVRLASYALLTGAVLGVTAGVLGAAAFAVAALSRLYASDRTLFAATIPVAAVGPAAYFLGRLLGG